MAKKDTLAERIASVEMTLELKVIPTLDKMDRFIDENKSGINLATLLNSRIIAVFLGGIVAAGFFFVGKVGIGL